VYVTVGSSAGQPLIITRFGSGLGPYGTDDEPWIRMENVSERDGEGAAAERGVLSSGYNHEEEVVHLLFARH